jgi:hypothetical protein
MLHILFAFLNSTSHILSLGLFACYQWVQRSCRCELVAELCRALLAEASQVMELQRLL